MDQFLGFFSLMFMSGILLFLGVSYMSGKRDLLLPSSFFLLGAANFVGLSGIQAGTAPNHMAVYTSEDYILYFTGVITFFFTLGVAYVLMRRPARAMGHVMRKWPPGRPSVLLVVIGCTVAFSVGQLVFPPIPIIAQMVYWLGNRSAIFALCLSVVAWYRQKINPIFFMIVIGMFVFSLVLSIATGSVGRRNFLGVLMTVPICSYWLYFRYKRPSTTLFAGGMAAVFLVTVLSAYSQIRFRDREREHDVEFAVESVQMLPEQVQEVDWNRALIDIGQLTTEMSLLTINMYAGTSETRPFHSVIWLASNPIPRVFWPDKPEGLGRMLPRDYGKRSEILTWGPGIVGHGYFEGGVHMLVFYGILAAAGLRFFDQLLLTQPDNPYVIAILVASAPHLVGWCRGDIAVFTMHIIFSFLAMAVLYVIASLLFGRADRSVDSRKRPSRVRTVPQLQHGRG